MKLHDLDKLKNKFQEKKKEKKKKKRKGDEWEIDEDSDYPVHEKYTEMGGVKE